MSSLDAAKRDFTAQFSVGSSDVVQVSAGFADIIPQPSLSSERSSHSDQCRRKSNRERFDHLTSFSDDEIHLLRATPLYDVLHNGAAVLQNSKGSRYTHDLSKPVDSIHTFLSHNWSVPRIKKFIALALDTNIISASIASALVVIMCFYLQASGVAPPIIEYKSRNSNEDPKEVGVLVRVFSLPAFLSTLFLKHDVCRFMTSGPMYFLDKTCIHQTDIQLKEQGIMKLGAFIAKSDRMLILYSDVYMKKLWTIYEVACFLSTKTTDCLNVVHVSLVFNLVICWISFYVVFFVYCIPGISNDVVAFLVYPTSWTFLACANRYGHKSLLSTWLYLQTFDVRQALCFDEKDRPKVESNIASFLKIKEYVTLRTVTEDALAAFNALIHSHVQDAMKQALGGSPFPYAHVTMACSLVYLPTYLDIASTFALKYGMADPKTWGIILVHCTNCFAIIPIHAEILAWMTSLFTHSTDIKEWLWVFFSWLLTLLSCGFFGICNWRYLYFHIDDGHMLTCVIYNASWLVIGAATWFFLYRHEKAGRRANKDAVRETLPDTRRRAWPSSNGDS